MAASIGTILKVDFTGEYLIVTGTVKLSNAPAGYPANGDTFSFAGQDAIKSSALPDIVDIAENPPNGQVGTGLNVAWIQGTTQANGKIQFLSAGADLGAGNYTAAQLATQWKFQAYFPRV